ncbi:hypothetical protein PV325_004983 [Microctonus aethiopoides]|nr:hypothetical protein PV325_004983 [Microctonus aethiopoides]KAK0085084.1 hypothetical protein PV326_006031 [Microctonus aethiopoides]
MVLTKEYRICMPLTVEEYRIGQLYMIARHSHEQSNSDEGVEVIINTECADPVYGQGQYTEKKINLSSVHSFQSFEYQSKHGMKITMVHRRISIELTNREVDFVDIAYDELSAKHYKEEEDPKFFQSKKSGRGPLVEGWCQTTQPIMCSYKLVNASFEIWGMQARVEDFIHKWIREILLLGHRQAFTWIDEWYDMHLKDVRNYEKKMHAATNDKILLKNDSSQECTSPCTPSTHSISSSVLPPTESISRSWFSWS